VLDFVSAGGEVVAACEVFDVLVVLLELASLPPPQETKVQRISAEKKRPSDLMRVLINEFIAV
jgi:hypothetical protein